jgi:hypothetical protein
MLILAASTYALMTVTEAISKSSLISRHITNWVFTLFIAVAYLLLLPMLLLNSGCRNACFCKFLVLFEKFPVYFVADI